MKNLRLTVYLNEDTSTADLANTFGQFEIIYPEKPGFDNGRYVQFRFDNVRMLTSAQLTHIYNLILTYEKSYGSLKFKMLHLFDDADGSASPIVLHCFRGTWAVVSNVTGNEMQSSTNLLTLI